MHIQFLECNPQHGGAFLGRAFAASAFEGARRCLRCSKAFLYSLCFILWYRFRTCFGLILRNLLFFCSVEFFTVWLACFLFLGCSVGSGICCDSRLRKEDKFSRAKSYARNECLHTFSPKITTVLRARSDSLDYST